MSLKTIIITFSLAASILCTNVGVAPNGSLGNDQQNLEDNKEALSVISQALNSQQESQASKIAIKELAQTGIKAELAKLRSYTRSNARYNLSIFTSKNPGDRCEARHTLPVKLSKDLLTQVLLERILYIIQKFLVWWEKRNHRIKALEVNNPGKNG